VDNAWAAEMFPVGANRRAPTSVAATLGGHRGPGDGPRTGATAGTGPPSQHAHGAQIRAVRIICSGHLDGV